jgi:DNA-binding NarL/FixJ family response regulator
VVARVYSGSELFNAVKQLSPSVAVTDITMPQMNGIEAARLIARHYPDVKVIALPALSKPYLTPGPQVTSRSSPLSKELIPAIEDVLAGRLYRSSGLD